MQLQEARSSGEIHFQGDLEVSVRHCSRVPCQPDNQGFIARHVVLHWTAGRGTARILVFPDSDQIDAEFTEEIELSRYCNAKFVREEGAILLKLLPNVPSDLMSAGINPKFVSPAAFRFSTGRLHDHLQRLFGAVLEATRLLSPTATRTQSWFDNDFERADSASGRVSLDLSNSRRTIVSNASVDELDSEIAGKMRMLRFVTAFIESVAGPGQFSSLSMLVYLQKAGVSIVRATSIDRNTIAGGKAHKLAKEVTGWLGRITRDLYMLTDCPSTQHRIYGSQHKPFEPPHKEATFSDMQGLLEYQLRMLVEEALFSSVPELNMSQAGINRSGAMVNWVRDIEIISYKETRVNDWKGRFLEGEEMPWLEKLRKLCPGKYSTTEEVLQLFIDRCGVLAFISKIKQCTTPVKKVRLWSDFILYAIKTIMEAMPPGTEPLGGPDLPQVALFLICHFAEDTYAHARLADLFTLDYMGHDQEVLDLAEGGLYHDTHDQYTYNAERRSIYPQMMLNYLTEGCEIIAEAALERRRTREVTL